MVCSYTQVAHKGLLEVVGVGEGLCDIIVVFLKRIETWEMVR